MYIYTSIHNYVYIHTCTHMYMYIYIYTYNHVRKIAAFEVITKLIAFEYIHLTGSHQSFWKSNNGISNTHIGGVVTATVATDTVISVSGDWYDVAGTFAGTDLQHFSASADGKLTHNGSFPREFEVTASLTIESQTSDEIGVRFQKWDDSASTMIPLDYTIQVRQVNSFVGSRDVAFFTMIVGVTLDQGDYIQMQNRNATGARNTSTEVGSFFRVQER